MLSFIINKPLFSVVWSNKLKNCEISHGQNIHKGVITISRRKNQVINLLAARALNDMKYEVAQELGYFQHQEGNDQAAEYEKTLDQMKYEVAEDLGIRLDPQYNGDMTTRDAGRIGGQMGGHIGGNMVRKMIEFAENKMADEYGKQ